MREPRMVLNNQSELSRRQAKKEELSLKLDQVEMDAESVVEFLKINYNWCKANPEKCKDTIANYSPGSKGPKKPPIQDHPAPPKPTEEPKPSSTPKPENDAYLNEILAWLKGGRKGPAPESPDPRYRPTPKTGNEPKPTPGGKKHPKKGPLRREDFPNNTTKEPSPVNLYKPPAKSSDWDESLHPRNGDSGRFIDS